MTTDGWLIIAIILLLLIFLWLAKPFFYLSLPHWKGYAGEKFVINTLNDWAYDNNLQAKARFYKTRLNQRQKIDLLLKIRTSQNVGIEVKSRNAENLHYFLMNHISRPHRDGSRQSSKQLYRYVKQKKILGLYAFVFVHDGYAHLHFLPHYIIEEMIRQKRMSVKVDEVISHPNGYAWREDNKAFLNYIEIEFQNQQNFLKRFPHEIFSPNS
ncbi:hypothetical protein MmiHf6_17300 [Methanimicrococcus hongohii]|uniref:Uncharacterized protein n=1 Tax=Methanimicrococcus hongohii TaxID=3028295 RepID=A0AA96V0Y5_9EURY|nr:hypothetical protein [Methanimicrococcus sp. Hf6]WNY24399.1 hypothetical protein MmiHf6_17300 [Methanimicrococcus sp. Hf6]